MVCGLLLSCFIQLNIFKVPSRLMAWISATTAKLELVVNKGTPEGSVFCAPLENKILLCCNTERILASQLTRALYITQGIALSHDSSKTFLGRKYCLEVSCSPFYVII